jgi:hypothetical protein
LGLHEKKTYGCKERNEEKRAQFVKVVATKNHENPVYIDESGIDNTEDYPYGYCQRGKRFHALKAGSKRQLVSMIAALNKRQILAPLTFEGYCYTEVFNAWFEQFLTPTLQPGQTVILDNATFHKSKKINVLQGELVLKFCIFLHILLILMKLSTTGLLSKIGLE